MLSRRDLLKSTLAAGAVGAVGSTVFVPLAAKAKAPLAGTQAPGYYRVMVGDVEVTALSDGAAQFPIADLYVNTTPEQARLALANAFQGTPTYLSVNAYLLNFGDRLVLLDAGTSDLMGPALGKLPANIVASGYHPDQIDDVVITHIHPDHTGGLTLAGAKVFPNATVHVPEADKAFWLSAENKANAPEDAKGFFDQAVASIKPYEDSNTLQTYAPDEAAIAGKINSTFRPGHTPGHSALWIESNGEKFVYWGDITHGDVVQFDDPNVAIAFDGDTELAIKSREAAFAEAVQEKYLVAGCHVAFPGLGHVREDATMYDWVPMNYRADV
ncbi:MBL fold metallo-hydrolase [Thalassospira tepidiphila]|jgi:glyoxylase-like metal-dependent hydrolase (beta-lactamase superfamily II)|uniref:MBL fold metallo-hydrolase n=1 Tax=Thalassospira tepidiphila TaxID=393657 RepID=UPI001BCCFE56|nr:MBL fold metallo-hydrolase [Thalassospira tepidiphila]MBS8273156.1 MBL fold metallo-hydrolase [Thalassospira tepidiphila]